MVTKVEEGGVKQKDWMRLCDWIDDGLLDNGLDEIARAVVTRKEVVHRRQARHMARSLKVGDKVLLTNKITPRWLEGVTGHILEMKEGAATVKLERVPTHRGRPPIEGQKDKILVPFAHLVKLGEDEETLSSIGGEENIGDDQDEDDEEYDDEGE